MTYKLYLIFICLAIIVFCGTSALAQCPPGSIISNYVFQDQDDIDSFADNYPNCTDFQGSIRIYGSDDYEDLSVLANITSIAGSLDIRNDVSLISAFSNLQSIGMKLRFMDDLDGGIAEIPNTITNVLGDNGIGLEIDNCNGISVTGLDGITTFDKQIRFADCTDLNFSALNNANGIESLTIYNGSGVDLSEAFTSLEYIIEDIWLYSLESGSVVELPNSLTTLTSDQDYYQSLHVTSCDSLTIIGGNGLTAMHKKLSVLNCNNLTFSGFTNTEELRSIRIEESSDIYFSDSFQSVETSTNSIYVNNCSGEIDFSGLTSLESMGGFGLYNCENISIIGLLCLNSGGNIIMTNSDTIQFSGTTYFGDIVESVSIQNSGISDFSMFSTGYFNPETTLFENLRTEHVIGDFHVEEVPLLSSYGGFAITEIGGYFKIRNAPLLPSLINGHLQQVGGYLLIDNVGFGMEGDFGFSGLIAVNGGLTVRNMPDYAPSGGDWEGFPQLELVGGDIYLNDLGIWDLHILRGVTLFDGIFSIYNCPNLNSCTIPISCYNLGYLDAPSDFSCNYDCSYESICVGQMFVDFDCDGNMDDGEAGIPAHVLLDDGELLGFTSSDGSYSVDLEPNTSYNITVGSMPGFTSDTTYSILTPEGNEIFTYNFPMCPTGESIPNLSVNVTPIESPRPGFSHEYEVCVGNLGNQISSGTVSFETASEDIITVTDAESGTIDGNSITWSFSDMQPFESMCFIVDADIMTGTLGNVYNTTVSVDLVGGTDDDLTNNTHTIEETIIGSYDPNDKLVNLELIDVSNYENDSLFTLEYLIRFQNTGTAPATFVRVSDNLPNELDPLTLEMISASHDYEISVEVPDKIIWFFDDINLADSTTNEPESHGFIHFRIDTDPNIEAGDDIENFVSIFFDYNEAVITEDAVTQFIECDEESIAIAAPEGVCAGDTFNLTANLPDFDSYTWTVEGEEISGEQQLQTAIYESGEVGLTIANPTCTLSTFLEIEVKAQPDLNLQSEPYYSCDASIELDIISNGQVSWFFGDSLIASGNTATLAESGLYNIANENECGMIEEELEVFLHEVNLEEPELICENDTVVLEPNYLGYDTFNWIIEGEQYSGDSISVAFSNDGSIELEAISEFCTDTVVWNFEVMPQPSMNISLEPYVGCFGEVQIDLDAVGVVNWWLYGLIFNTGDPVTLEEPGTYNVIVANDCNTIENEVIVEVYDIPEVDLSFASGQLVVAPEGTGYQWFLDGNPIDGNGPVITPTENGQYTVIVYFENSICSQTSSYILNSVSVSEQLTRQIKIHPNPTQNFTTIQLPQGEWTISLLTSKGQVLQIHEQIIDTRFQLNLEKFAPGLYFIRVDSHNGSAVKKLIVE